ncbi:MAG TPA: ABC transporter substrate-binding protein [Xanthobacteraceae bacterium]|jgi:branched-chain amino acid transport system substrate-binding protein|nr:ABC transporter substrate-binding protein [Xanthobacteraceae bacterium]
MFTRIAFVALGIAGLIGPAFAQDGYVIGVTGALTGPVASTQAPAMEAMRIYVERLNAAGGINGKQVRIILQDDAAEPSKAAANAKKLITQDNVVLLINASLSSTYAPTVAEAKRAGVPLLFASGVCPKEVYPPADPLQFCTTAYASNYDSRATLAFIKDTAKEPVRIGFAAMAIPLSRGEMDFAESQAPSLGMTVADKEVIPPPTPDYTPFATKLKDANANWVFSWAPWVTQVRTLEALRRLGWGGSYIAWSHLEAEGELARLKDANFYVIGANSLFQDDLPIHREVADAAKKANASYPGNQMAEGWIAGMVIEAALKNAGWPADAAKVRSALETVKVDTKGLRGGAMEWTKDNHFRTRQYYRVYRWDPAKSAIVVVKDWMPHDVK